MLDIENKAMRRLLLLAATLVIKTLTNRNLGIMCAESVVGRKRYGAQDDPATCFLTEGG